MFANSCFHVKYFLLLHTDNVEINESKTRRDPFIVARLGLAVAITRKPIGNAKVNATALVYTTQLTKSPIT